MPDAIDRLLDESGFPPTREERPAPTSDLLHDSLLEHAREARRRERSVRERFDQLPDKASTSAQKLVQLMVAHAEAARAYEDAHRDASRIALPDGTRGER